MNCGGKSGVSGRVRVSVEYGAPPSGPAPVLVVVLGSARTMAKSVSVCVMVVIGGATCGRGVRLESMVEGDVLGCHCETVGSGGSERTSPDVAESVVVRDSVIVVMVTATHGCGAEEVTMIGSVEVTVTVVRGMMSAIDKELGQSQEDVASGKVHPTKIRGYFREMQARVAKY